MRRTRSAVTNTGIGGHDELNLVLRWLVNYDRHIHVYTRAIIIRPIRCSSSSLPTFYFGQKVVSMTDGNTIRMIASLSFLAVLLVGSLGLWQLALTFFVIMLVTSIVGLVLD